MFNGKQLNNIEDRLHDMENRMIELKVLMLQDRKEIMHLTAELRDAKNYTFVKKIKKPRKKALRKAQGWKNVSPEEAQGFVDDYNAGLSILEIANQAGRSSSTVGNWIHKLTDGDENEPVKAKK